jgi:protein-L-isoaspartate(D-aspartate) O-methyltransferase
MKSDFARRQMVDQQVRAWDVLDETVLDVLKAVHRERFVPKGFENLAFADTEIPIGHGQAMMTPTIEGRVLQSLRIDPDDVVLEVGTGTGFLAACLAQLAAEVTSVDIHEDFLKKAEGNLENAGVQGISLLAMDATRELPGETFDAIAVTGSIQTFDPRLVMALNPGGRLFVVVGDPPVMDARLVERTGENEWKTASLFETCLTPLLNGALPRQFSF